MNLSACVFYAMVYQITLNGFIGICPPSCLQFSNQSDHGLSAVRIT